MSARHLSEVELVAYAEGGPSGGAQHRLGGHLAHCPACSEALTQLRETARAVTVLPSVPPPSQTFRKHVAIAGKSQADLVMGTLGPFRRSP